MSSLFGLDQSNRLVFVSEVARGLACQCKCVVCREPLIARQGSVREHHFAHASGREPCEANHESLLHQYAKQVIQEAGALTVPLTPVVVDALGLDAPDAASTRLRLPAVEAEKALQNVRPDLLAHTEAGVALAIEVAYSSFCDMLKVSQFAEMGLPVLEIDLRAFTPEAFDPAAVRDAVLDALTGKAWLWPVANAEPEHTEVAELVPIDPPAKKRLPEEIVTISGRWVSIKEFPSGDIAVRVVSFDPDVVSIVKSVAKANLARYAPAYKSWNVPRWRAESVRTQLRGLARSVTIASRDRADRQ